MGTKRRPFLRALLDRQRDHLRVTVAGGIVDAYCPREGTGNTGRSAKNPRGLVQVNSYPRI